MFMAQGATPATITKTIAGKTPFRLPACDIRHAFAQGKKNFGNKKWETL
jgi:hypothetical protein